MTGVKSVYQRGLDAPVAGPNRRGTKRVAIVGAGACGICAAKYLLEVGFEVTVYEIGSQIGGMWCYLNDNGRSSAYRTLHINTSRGVTRFSDLDFDAHTQDFPDHVDMHRYLKTYAEHFDVSPRIRFHSRVTQIRPAFDPGCEASQWDVTVEGCGAERFDAVIVATGHLTRPYDVPELTRFGGAASEPTSQMDCQGVGGLPSIHFAVDPRERGDLRTDSEPMSPESRSPVASALRSIPASGAPRPVSERHPPSPGKFTPQYLHSHHYKAPEPYVGKRICVVGIGNSACDIASDVCVTSPRCVLVARSGVLILPKLLFGRAFTDITAQIQRPWIPRALRRRITRFLTWLAHGDMTRLGFKRPQALTHVTSNATVVTDIAYRRIEVKQGIAGIDGRTIRFDDGTAEEFDVLIAATGYRIDLDIVPREIVNADDNQLGLYMRIVPPGWPGLFFMGFFNTDTALNMVFEHQARWVREILLGNAVLPDLSEMQRAIEERAAWYARQYNRSARHTIEEEHVRYLGDLRKTLREMVTRRQGAVGRVTGTASAS